MPARIAGADAAGVIDSCPADEGILVAPVPTHIFIGGGSPLGHHLTLSSNRSSTSIGGWSHSRKLVDLCMYPRPQYLELSEDKDGGAGGNQLN